MPKYAVAVEDAKYEVEAPDEQTAWNWAVYTHQNQPKAQPPAPFSLADVGLTGAAAVAGAGKSVLQAFGPEALGVETLGGIQKSLLEMRTPERQAEVARRTAIEQQAAKTGTATEEIGAFLGGIKEAPIQSIAQGIGSTVPALLTGAAALVAGAPLGMTTAVVIGARFLFGALQGAGEVKGTIYDNVYRELRNQGISDVDAKRQAEAAQDYIGNNTDNIFVGAGLGALAGGTGAEKILSNYVAKKMGVDLAAGAAKKEAEGLIMRGVKEALKEGIPEGLQGGQEQFASNVALAREGIETPEFEGVLGSAARDAALGALTGGVVSPFGRQKAAPQAEAPIEKLPEDQLISLRDRYNEAENELQKLADAAKAPDLTPEAKQAAIESFINFKNNIFAPLRLEFSKYRPQIDALTPKTEPTVEPGVEPAPTAKAPEPAAGPLDEAGLRDLNTRFQEAKKQLSLLKNLTRGRDLTPEQRQEAVNAYKDFKVNIFNPIQQEYGKNRQAILALPKVVTLPPTPPAPPAAPPTAAQPPAAPPVAPGATPTDPTIDQPSGEPPRNTSTPSPIVDEPKSTEPPATPVEEPTGLPTPPEKREFQIDTPKEQIAKDVQGMTIPELARWAVINAPNTPARQFALKAFDRINQFADRGIFPGKIRVLNGGIRNESGTRGRVRYKHYLNLKKGFDMSLTLNGIPTNGVADRRTGTQYSTILHELLHAATVLEVQFNPDSKPVKELKNLYARVKAQVKMDIKNGVQHPALEGIKRGANTMLDVDELIAWGLTDKNFQDYLSGIKVGDKTAFTKFVEIMRKLLNINPEFETALDSLMRSTENLLSTPVSEMEKGMGIKLRGAQIMKGAPAAPVELQKTAAPKAPVRAPKTKAPTAEETFEGTTEEREVSPLGFYSALADQVDRLNIKSTTPEGWKQATKGLLNKGLVKQDEVEWTGLNDWLDLQQGKVTKEQVMDYLREGGVRVEETVLGNAKGFTQEMQERLDELEANNDRTEEEDAERQRLISAENAASDKFGDTNQTKYGQYVLPGGENYREVLLRLAPKLPTEAEAKAVVGDAMWERMTPDQRKEFMQYPSAAEAKRKYKSPHWDQPNVLAHIRMNDRTDADGKRVLFIEEIQSDWGQKGKKEGFVKRVVKNTGDFADSYPWRIEGTDNVFVSKENAEDFARRGIPSAPFVTKTEGWLNLALKRIITMAAEGGYDRVAFVNGEQSADRYDLSKQVDKIAIYGDNKLVAFKNGTSVTSREFKNESELAEIIGKEAAKKLLESKPDMNNIRSLEGQDLKVGGEGMKAFYDKIVPAALKKLLPKVGGDKMADVSLPIDTRDYRQRNIEVNRFRQQMYDKYGDGIMLKMSKEELAKLRALEDGRSIQPGFDITPDMRDQVIEGVELFESVPTDSTGARAVDIIGKMGMGVQPPAPSAFQKARQDVKTALENPKLTVESAKKATAGFLDRFETATFSSSSAFDNQLRRAVAADIKENEEVIGMLIDASQSQAVHADALASQFIIEGGIRYDEEYKKWVSYKEPDNFVELGKQINEIAKKYNISEDEARRITHTYFMSKRLRSLQERNEQDKARIEELKAERDVAKTKDEKAKINREIERLKDREAFIHLDDPEIELGLSLGEMMPELGKVADTWNGIRRNARRVLVNSGLWTEEYADQMLDVIDYVPFYREVQLEEGQGPREFVRGLQVQAKEHRLKGTNKPVNDILDNMVRWTQYAVNRSVRNDKAVRMIDAALKIEMGDGTKMAERVEKAERGMNVVRIWRDGKQELYNMADPLFADAFTGIQSIAIEPLNWFSKVANTLRDSVVLFPLFSVAQVPQDAFAAMFSSGLQPQYALRIPILAVKEFIKTLSKSSETHQVLKRFGAVGVRDFNSSVIRDDAEVFAGIKAPPGVKGKIKEYLQHIAMSADNSIRQAVYEASVQQGLSKAEALEKAFEIINFRRRGTNKMFQLAGQTIPFFYAYLAAQRVAYNTLSGTGISPQDRKAAWKTLMYTSAAVMTLSMLYAMMAADDEDYKKTPAAIRDRTLTIPGTGGLRIPLRTDFFLFPKIVAEHTYLLMTDKGYEDGAKFRKSMINALGEALFSPTLVPQLAKPAVEALINYDFYQARPILGQYEKQKEWSRQFNESTSEVSKLLGKTGAVSPIMADHLFRGFFGTTGGLFLWFTNTAINKSGLTGVAAPEKTWREAVEAFPGTSGFLSRTNESALRTDFYELRDKVNTAAATFNDIKKNNPQGIKDYLEDEKRMARLVVNKQVENVNQKLAELRARIRQINEAPTTMMTGAEKADAIRQLRQIEDQIYKSINVKGLREKAQM
jgi:hypothetical protein